MRCAGRVFSCIQNKRSYVTEMPGFIDNEYLSCTTVHNETQNGPITIKLLHAIERSNVI